MLLNIPKLYIVKIAKWFMLTMPIIVPFYESNHLTGKDILLLQSIYSISTLLLEIPTGYFADVVGRKTSILAGSFLGVIGFSIYAIADGFLIFLIAEIVLGLGSSFVSGSDSAMLYDTLLQKNKENEYLKQEGRITSIGNFAEAIAGIASGFLATISLRLPFYFQIGVAMLAVPAAITLVEPSVHKAQTKLKFSNILSIVRFSLVEQKKLRWYILLSSVIGAATLTMAWFAQFFFKSVDIPIAIYGVIWTALNFTVGITALYAFKIEQWVGRKSTIISICAVISVGFILIGLINSVYAFVVLFVFYVFRGLATPVLKNYINELSPSDKRATILSIRNFIIRLTFAVIGPFIGWWNDFYSLSSALIVAGLIFSVFSLMILLVVNINSLNNKLLQLK